MYSLDLNVHCEICAYSRFCETKELKGVNNSVLNSLFSLPSTTSLWASSCILGNQWLKRFHRVSAWLRVIWQIYELCWLEVNAPRTIGILRDVSFSDTLLKNDAICHALFYERTDSRKLCESLFQSIRQLVQSSAVFHYKKTLQICKSIDDTLP